MGRQKKGRHARKVQVSPRPKSVWLTKNLKRDWESFDFTDRKERREALEDAVLHKTYHRGSARDERQHREFTSHKRRQLIRIKIIPRQSQ